MQNIRIQTQHSQRDKFIPFSLYCPHTVNAFKRDLSNKNTPQPLPEALRIKISTIFLKKLGCPQLQSPSIKLKNTTYASTMTTEIAINKALFKTRAISEHPKN